MKEARGMLQAIKTEELVYWGRKFTYDHWMESIGIPIHKGYYVEDLRTLELGWWEERQCRAAFVQLVGSEGIASTTVTEIPPGKTLPPWKFALNELVYVADGRGLTTIWAKEGGFKKTFEWDKQAMFMIPHNYWRQFSNMQGDKPVRLMHYSYLPLVLSGVRDPGFLFNSSYDVPDFLSDQQNNIYSEAKLLPQNPNDTFGGTRVIWYGNYFPDLGAWDKLSVNNKRGGGGLTVSMQFTDSEMFSHMSVFSARTYKKAHRHGPGRVIVIPAGEGYSIMWEEGKEKVVVPWHEGSAFTPPNKWFHQHFNLGATPARYLAFHSSFQFYGHAEKVEDKAKDQIEYTDEDPWIRQKFEEELSKRGITSLMPDETYRNRDYEWKTNALDKLFTVLK